jgi:hypothetical protein
MSVVAVSTTGMDDPQALAGWMSSELLEKTQKVWSKVYGRSITQFEAVQILRNVKRMAELVYRPKGEIPLAAGKIAA